jgi:hypothetical protein
MRGDQSQLVRDVAEEHFVRPAKARGLRDVVIPVKQLRDLLVPTGFPAKNIPQICSALEANAFRRANGFESVSVEGPASKRSTTVVFHFRFPDKEKATRSQSHGQPSDVPVEDSAARAKRLTGKLFGLLKDELAEYGGGEAFLKWMRSEDDEEVR